MIDGIVTPVLRDIDYITPAAPYPVIPSGLTIHENPIYRYSVPADEQPVLTIENYIPDHNGNFIKPGHYTLALSDDREFLYLLESRELIAVIPVFKLAENKSELEKMYKSKKDLTMKEKYERLKKKNKDKIKKIIDEKYAKTGATPPQEFKYMNAEIEYIKEGGYYLIMYENGYLRAWGAVKE